MGKHIIWRNGIAQYYRRIPSKVRPFLEPETDSNGRIKEKTHVKISLETQNQAEAEKKALIYSEHIEEYWKNVIENFGEGTDSHYQIMVKRAKAHGFKYRPVSTIKYTDGKDRDEIVSRLLTAANHIDNDQAVSAILGGVEKPEIKLSDCIPRFEKAASDLSAGKNAHEYRVWINPRIKAMNNMAEAIGDITVNSFDRQHALEFKEWWADRIADEGLNPGTANKDFIHSKQVLERVAEAAHLEKDFDYIFTKIKFKNRQVSRLPFEVPYIKDVILPALQNIAPELRMIAYARIDTGCRNKEIVGVLPSDIRLDTDIPHIVIQANSIRGVKTDGSERVIPLVGLALEAFKAFPNGFEYYRSGNLNNSSNALGKFFDENGLNPTERHSPYSFRHSFKDRLRDVDVNEEIIDALMGHKTNKPQYGSGFTLEKKRDWLQRIVF